MINSTVATYAAVTQRTPKPTLKVVPYLTGQQLLDLAERDLYGPITRSKSSSLKIPGQSPTRRAGKTKPVGISLRVQHYLKYKEAADHNLGYNYRKYRLRNPKSVLTRAEKRQVEHDIEIRSDPGKVYRENSHLCWVHSRQARTPPPEVTYPPAYMYRFISDCVDSVSSTTLLANLDRFQRMQISDAGPSSSRQTEHPAVGPLKQQSAYKIG